MNDFIAAVGLVLVIEGLLYAVFPGVVRRMMEIAREMPDSNLRAGGLIALIVGVLIVWLARA
ncbi:MAG: DUF2065 domain-containing protein [Hyphomicrobiales bacterium]|nr:DUF2065 domain-containing protein [Hyphomicrobiales bacterium]